MAPEKQELNEFEKQILRIERAKLLISLAALEYQQHQNRRRNRSVMDKIDDFLFC